MAKQGMKRPNDKNNNASDKSEKSIPQVTEIHNKADTTMNKKSNTNNQYR